MGLFSKVFKPSEEVNMLREEVSALKSLAREFREFADISRGLTSEPVFPDAMGPEITSRGNQPEVSTLLREQKGTVDTAINAVADRVSDLNLEVVKVMRGGESRVVEKHPAVVMMKQTKPRADGALPLHNLRQQLRLTTQYMLGPGEAYWLKIRDGLLSNVTRRFMVLRPDMVKPVVRSGLVIGYILDVIEDNNEIIPASEFIRMWYPDPSNLYLARGALGPQAIEYDSRKFAAQHSKSHFQHDASPRVVLESEAGSTMPDDATQRRSDKAWNDAYNGRAGASRGNPARLPPGWKAHVLDLDRGEEITIKILDHFDKHMLRTFKVPRSVLGDVSDAPARAAAEVNQYVFDLYAVSPVTSMIEDSLNEQWIVPEFGPEYRIQFQEFVSKDKEFELRRDESDIQNKIRAPDEIREARRWKKSSWGHLPVAKKNDRPYTGEIEKTEIGVDPLGLKAKGDKDKDDEDEDK